MDTIIVYVDDAAYAQHQLAPMKATAVDGQPVAPTHWVLVACAPRLTRRIGKWVSNSAREKWRGQWADKLFAQLSPGLATASDRVTPVVATGPLPQLTERLRREYPNSRVLDARRPKLGHNMMPVVAGQPIAQDNTWTVPGAVAGIGALLVLAAE